MSENSCTLDAALTYIKRGWPVFPIKCKTKIPLVNGGFKSATTDDAKVRFWFGVAFRDANIGIPTGLDATFDVVDIDPRHGGDLALEHLLGDNLMPETPTAKTGGGGIHYCFRHEPGFKNSANAIGKGIDTRGEGGYIVVAPSLHESGNRYEWLDESDTLPLAKRPAWLAPGGTLPRAQGNIPDVPYMPPKASGEPVATGARNVSLASLVGQWLAEGCTLVEIKKRAYEWNATNAKPLPLDEVDRTVNSMVRTHQRNNPGAAIEISEPEEAPEPAPTFSSPGAFPGDLLNPPGLVGELCQWINATAIKPQPVLALANSLAFWGAVFGRKVQTTRKLRTNIYTIGLAESGCGKEHSRACVKEVCSLAGVDELLGGEELSSDAALCNAVHKHPSILFQIDEVGHFFLQANSRNSATHQKNIGPTFTKLFSSAASTYKGKEYAGADRKDVIQPNCCLYGTTVASRFFQGVTTDEVTDGFLPRMIFFPSNDPDPEIVDTPLTDPPTDIVDMVKWWVHRSDMPHNGNGNISSMSHTPHTVPISPDAVKRFYAFLARIKEYKKQTRESRNGLDAIWTRANEHALKVALIISCGCEPNDLSITEEHADWAIEIVETSIRLFVAELDDNISGSEFERTTQYVYRPIKAAGMLGISANQLCRATRRINMRTRQESLAHLIGAGMVREKIVQTKGRTAKTFVTA